MSGSSSQFLSLLHFHYCNMLYCSFYSIVFTMISLLLTVHCVSVQISKSLSLWLDLEQSPHVDKVNFLSVRTTIPTAYKPSWRQRKHSIVLEHLFAAECFTSFTWMQRHVASKNYMETAYRCRLRTGDLFNVAKDNYYVINRKCIYLIPRFSKEKSIIRHY